MDFSDTQPDLRMGFLSLNQKHQGALLLYVDGSVMHTLNVDFVLVEIRSSGILRKFSADEMTFELIDVLCGCRVCTASVNGQLCLNWVDVLCGCRVCTASVDGQLCLWDTDSVLRLNRIQLDIDDKYLSSLRYYQDKFLCCKLTLVFSLITKIIIRQFIRHRKMVLGRLHFCRSRRNVKLAISF